MHSANIRGANTVTKDFLCFSQPFIHEGALLSSSSSGRRLYIHHLSEVPLSEVFSTRVGNHLQRLDNVKVTLAGIEIEVGPPPEASAKVPTARLLSQIPTAAFSGSVSNRDKLVLQLLQRGKDANAASDFVQACACFEAAYALSVRGGMLVSAANMRLKLGEPETAAAMYRMVLTETGAGALLDSEREMATRKLGEATAQLGGEQAAGGGGGGSSSSGSQGGGAPAAFKTSSPSAKSPPTFAAAAASGSGGGGGWNAFGDAGGDGGDDDFDGDFDDGFADFEDAPRAKPHRTATTPKAPASAGGFSAGSPSAASHQSSTGGFADFGGGGGGGGGGFEADFGGDDDGFEANFGDSAPPPPPVQVQPPSSNGRASMPVGGGGGGSGSFAADLGDMSGGGLEAASVPSAHKLAHGGSNGGGASADVIARLEARLARLEQKVGSGKSTDGGERLEALSAQVERRMKGVKAGMEALHGRLQAVEVAMAKLPEHLKSFKSKAKEQAKLGRAHTEQIAALERAMPGVSKAATECNRRVAELQKLAAALASGSDEALELAAAAGDVEAQAGEDGGEAQEPPVGAGEGAAAEEPEPLMVPAPSRSDSTTAGGADGFDAFLSPQPAELAHSDLGSVSDFGGMMSASPFTAASSSPPPPLIGGVSGSLGDLSVLVSAMPGSSGAVVGGDAGSSGGGGGAGALSADLFADFGGGGAMSDGAASALAGDFTPTAAASSGLDGVVGSAVEPAVANPTSEAASTSPSAPPGFPADTDAGFASFGEEPDVKPAPADLSQFEEAAGGGFAASDDGPAAATSDGATGDGAGFAPFGSFDEPQLLSEASPAKSDEQPHPVEPISASPFEATDSGEAAGAERAGEGGATEGGAAEGGATEAYGDFGDFEDEDAEAEAELQREIERAKAEREAARSGDAASSVPSPPPSTSAVKAVGEDDFAAFGDAEPAAAGDSAAFAAFGDENPNSDFPAADGFASFAASNDSSSSKGSTGLNGGVGVGPVAGVGGGPADEAAALEVELENARRERERIQMELAEDGFLASLTHSEDPKVGERLASGDGASVATDDIADEYASFEAGQLEAREKSFEAISSTVTDDEFNSLFGPVQ